MTPPISSTASECPETVVATVAPPVRGSRLAFLKPVIVRAVAAVMKLLLHPRLADSPKLFQLLEQHGYHLTKVHFYSPIPNTADLGEDVWSSVSALAGIDMNLAAQLALLAGVQQRFKPEYDQFPMERRDASSAFWIDNGMFVSVDAEMLYSLVRLLRPKRMIEIGSGFSTLITDTALQATRQEAPGYECEFTCVDPYPPEWLSRQTRFGRLVEQPIQKVGLTLIDQLDTDDILFIDSSHVAKIASDVTWEILELLPRVRPGVFVHFHDIFLPSEYPRKWVKEEKTFWNEQYLLQAFLAFNRDFEIVWAGHYMHYMHPEKLHRAFRSYDPKSTLPASLWLRRKCAPGTQSRLASVL